MTNAALIPLGVTRAGQSCWNVLVWAPAAHRVRLVEQPGACSELVEQPRACSELVEQPGACSELVELESDGYGGYYHGVVESMAPGERYMLERDGQLLADPASRSQPDGVHGASALVDLAEMCWSDAGFVPAPLEESVIYELHVGTFTRKGTLDSATEGLDRLAELGVTAVELMPLAQFPGARNWGYDGVFPFAVQNTYGGPAALQGFVDACHSRGLAVVLDVVYNHLGPEGNVLSSFGPYVTAKVATPWGPAVNFEGEGSDEVRRYFIENALMWLCDFHVDMLRLDAVHGIVDRTARSFVQELSDAVAALSKTTGRSLVLIAESADNDPMTTAPVAAGGSGFDAQWCDDFHHALHAKLTGERRGYYCDFGGLGELARAMTDGFVLQGQYCRARKRRHGAVPSALGPSKLVVFGQNHDQIGNRPGGERLSTLVPEKALGLAAACTILSPFVPLLFMGEEYGEPAPFCYFVDHEDAELLERVRSGRAAEMGALFDMAGPDPAEEATFASAVIHPELGASGGGAGLLATYQGLLELRRTYPAFCRPEPGSTTASGVGDLLVVTRRGLGAEVVLLANFGTTPASASLHAAAQGWEALWSSERPSRVDNFAGDQAGAAVRIEPLGFRVFGRRSDPLP
ncbi:MAG: malto-oligosyltrehalose trehalohydrolase [Acidimicrobiales bacterium]